MINACIALYFWAKKEQHINLNQDSKGLKTRGAGIEEEASFRGSNWRIHDRGRFKLFSWPLSTQP